MGKARDLKKKKRGEGVKAKKANANKKSGGNSDSEEDLEQVLKEYIREAKELNEFPLTTMTMSERPMPPRSGASLVCVGEKCFYFGGECRSADDTLNYFNDLFLLKVVKNSANEKTIEWKKAQVKSTTSSGSGGNGGPGPRSAHQMAVAPFHPTQALLFGGEYGSKRDTKFLQYRDFWLLHTTPILHWQRVEFKTAPGPRSGHRMLGWRNYVVLFGGYVDSGRGELKYLNDLWLLDMRTMSWKCYKSASSGSCASTGSCWPTPRSGFCFGAVDDLLYVIGGYQSQVLNDAYSLELQITESTEVSVKWTRMRNVPNFNRSGMSCVSIGPQLLLFGGITDNLVTDDRIHGQCTNDLYELCNGIFTPRGALEVTGRYNAAMCRLTSTGTTTSFLLVGGIVENVDEELALDDVILISTSGPKQYRANVLQPLSFTIPEPMQISDDDSDDSASNDSNDEDDSNDEYDEYESDDDSETDSSYSSSVSDTHPNVRKGQTLREYFQEHLDYWISINQSNNNPNGGVDLDESEKEQRRLAFEACKLHFESLSLNNNNSK